MGNPAVNGSPVGANDNQQLTPFQTYLSNERLAGKNWDAIHTDMAARIEAAHNAGHTDEEIARSMDLSTDAYEQARANAGIAHAVVNPTRSQYGGTIPDTAGPLNFFQAGVKGSSGGEIGVTIAGQNPSETQWSPSDHAGIVNTTAYMAGQIIGDTPAMLAGAGVATLAAPETAGASLAGAFALPGMMKKTYALNLQNGTIKDPVDFVSRVGAVSIEGAEQGGIGIATAGAGSSVGAMLDQAGVKGFGKWITKNAAEYLTMTAGQAVASGQLPSREQLLDGALLLAVVHLGGKLTPHAGAAAVHAHIGSGTGEEAEVTPGLVNTTQTNLLEAFADHGIAVPDAVKAGVQDPVVRQGLQTPRDGPRHVAPGSSQTGPIYDHEPNSAPTMTVSRPPNNFEAATSFIFKEEGGYTIDANGAGVNMGINQADHPEVDVKHLTRQEAADIYYKDYWEPMGIDKLPDNMKLPVYDAAIVEGIPKARQMLEESGNDPVRFSEIRLEHYRSLARDNPAKYGRYLKTWEARTQRTMGGVKLSDGVDLARELNSGEPASSPDMDRWVEDDPDETRDTPGFLSRFAQAEEGSVSMDREADHRDDNNRDFIERVNNATADPTKPDGIVKTTQVWAHKLYQELFNPNDPLGRLVRDVRRGGGTIDDANNPLLLQRMAETSPNYVMKAISEKGDMVNLKGDKVGPSMGKILAPFGKEDPKGINFWGYYSARWAADLMQRGMKTPMDPQDVLDYIQAGHAKYGDAFNQMVELNNQSLHWLVEGDIKTQAEYNAAVAANRAYMPAQRVREGVEPMRGPATGRTVFDPMWRLKGSELQLLNPQEAIIKNLFLRHSLASHNLVMKAAADAATKYGFARDEGTVKGVSPPLNADELSKDGLNPDLEQRMTDLMGDHVKGDEVPVFRDGMMHKVLFHDPELRTMLHGLDDLQLKFWDKLMAIPAKVQRTSIVTSPSFPIHILQYDLVFQQLTKTGQNTIAQAYLGTKNVFGHTPLWDEWERKGAPDRVLDGYTKSKFVQDVLKDRSDPTIMDNVFNAVGWAPKQAWRALRAWGMMTSQIMPVGRYAMLKARGNVSQEQMAWQASEAPFHRSGFGGVVGKRLNSGMPFTTAWLNGLEKMSRAAIGHPRPGEERLDAQGKPIEWDTKALASFYAKGLGITAVVLSQAMLNHNQLWYQAEPKWVKDNSLFLIHLGGDWEATGKTDPRTGAPIYIPHGITIPWRLPPIASTLFGAIPRRLAEQFVYDNPHAWDDFAADAAAGFTPPSAMIPSMIQPVIEQLTNYSIHGNHPLVPDAAQRDLDTPEQYTPYTTSTAKMIAGAINAMPGINMLPLGPNMRPGASPIIVDNYINEIGAGGVSEITHAIDNIGSAMGITGGHAAARSWDDDVIAHSLAERYPGFSADPIKAFDARYATFMHTRGALAQAIQNDDYDTFVRKIQENPDLAGLAAPHAARNAAPPPDIDQFVGAIQGARHGIDPNGPAMMWFKTARAIKDTERRYDIIDSLPTHPSADHPNSPWETPIEKRQQLDSMQATLMVMAMRSNHWADQAGIK